MSFWKELGKIATQAIGPLIGVGGSLIGAKQQSNFDKEAMNIQNQHVLGQMAQQNQYNIDAFNRENEYNSPLAQRQRNMAAGINTNFTDAGSVAASQDSGTGGSASALNSVDLSSLIQSASQLSLLPIQKQIMYSQKANIDADTHKKDVESDYTEGSLTSLASAQIEEALSKANLNDKNRDYLTKEIQRFDERVDAEIRKMKSEALSFEAAIFRIKMLLPKELKLYDSEIEEKLANAAYLRVLNAWHPYQSKTSRISANAAATSADAAMKTAFAAVENSKANTITAYARMKEVKEIGRHNHKVELLTESLNDAQIELNRSLSNWHDSQTFYQDIKNKVEDSLEKSGMLYHERNLIISRISADYDYITSQTFRNKQEAEFFADSYFGKLWKEYVPSIIK